MPPEGELGQHIPCAYAPQASRERSGALGRIADAAAAPVSLLDAGVAAERRRPQQRFDLGELCRRERSVFVEQRPRRAVAHARGLVAAASLAVILAVLTSGGFAMWSLIAIGLFNSIMFPTIFALGIDGLGALTSRGSSLLVMAIVGGAIIPLVIGAIADRAGIQGAFAPLVICYLYILYYGVRGSRHPGMR